MKDKLLILPRINEGGFIEGYEIEFFDGTEWQTPFDTTKAIELPQSEIAKIKIGVSKIVDGKVIVDQDKLEALVAEEAPQTTAEQQMIAALSLKVMALQQGGTTSE